MPKFTQSQKLTWRARHLADLCHEAGSCTFLSFACRRKVDQVLGMSRLVHAHAATPGHLRSAGQCEWILAHLDVCRAALEHVQAISPPDGPREVHQAHLLTILDLLAEVRVMCQTFARYRDPPPYDVSRHALTPTPDTP